MTFVDKIVLVTGARKGIGRAIVESFIKNGATVIGTSTSIYGTQSINEYLNNRGKGVQLDITQQHSIDICLKLIYQEFGRIDILVNNAGIIQDNLLLHMKNEEWQSVINVNLTAVFRMSKAVIKPMIRKNYGRIINIGSVIGTIGNIGQVNYAASKAGLVGLTKALARESASWGITINVVAPGFIHTDMTQNLTDKYKNDILSKIPMNRFGELNDVAHAVIFLASDNAKYITGQTIHVNGGMYMG